MNDIKWTTEEVAVEKLKGYADNPREITSKNLALLKDSVETYGQVVPLVVNQDYTVLGGNQRIKVLNGIVKVKVPSRMLTQQEEKELVIILNNKLGEWDFFKVEALGFDKEALINEFGFDEEYIAKNEINLDDFDFDDFNPAPDFDSTEEDKLVKQFVLNFTGLSDNVQELFEKAMKQDSAVSIEDLILKRTRKYAKNND